MRLLTVNNSVFFSAKVGFEMKIQMRGGDNIVHTVRIIGLLYWLLAVNTTSSVLLPSGYQEDIFGTFPPQTACYLLTGCHSVIWSMIK